MKINIIVGEKKFEELSLDEQEEIKERITNVQRHIVIERLTDLIKKDKIEELMNYLKYCSNYVVKK